MSTRPVVLRERAQHDVVETVEHYRIEASTPVALAFVDALEQAFRGIGEYPASGSPRYARELDLPGLRSYLVTGFPYVVFYIEGAEDIDVWRVLHAVRHIPAWLQEPPED